jgi:branched-chain amino acid transport system substrate-binding protein
MQVVIDSLRENPTRNGLQQVLSHQGFSVSNGTATGTVKFLPSGDRDGATIMLKVQPSNSQTGYDIPNDKSSLSWQIFSMVSK